MTLQSISFRFVISCVFCCSSCISFNRASHLNTFNNRHVPFNDKDPPWTTNYIKYKIHCKKSLYLKYLKHSNRNCDYIELHKSIEEFSEDISKTKEQYYDNLAKKLNKTKRSPKTYWTIMKTFYNGKKIPLIPPLLINDKLEFDFGKRQIISMSFCIKVYSIEQWKYFSSFIIKYTNSRTFFLSV